MHTNNQWSVSSGKNSMRYIQDVKFGMLQVRENEISLRKWSGGTAQLRTQNRKRPRTQIEPN